MDKFFADVRELGGEIARRDAEIFGLYVALKDEAHPFRAELEMLWGRILSRIKACGERGLSDEILVALLDRLVQLRENSIIQELEKMGVSEGEIWEIREELLAWVLEFDREGARKLRVHKEKFGALEKWYLEIYENLARHYAQKRDALLWLEKFVDVGGEESARCGGRVCGVVL